MKRLLIFIFSLFLVFALIALPVYAQTRQNVILPRGETVKHDYFGAGEQVQISGTVDGDTYVAGGTVVVDGTVNGDLLAAGGNVTVTGTVRNNIRVAGGNVTIADATVGGNVTAAGGQVNIDRSARISGSLVAAGGNLQVFAPIPRGATIAGGNVLLSNYIGGDVLAGVGQLTLSQNADVRGSLTYWSDKKAEIAQGASVSGKITQRIPENAAKSREIGRDVGRNMAAAAVGAVTFFKIMDALVLLIFGLLLIALFPVYTVRAQDYVRTKFGWALLTGLVAIIVTPIVGIILFITILGIPAALILLFFYVIIIWFARILAIGALGRFAINATSYKVNNYWTYVVGTIIYLVLSLIPVVSFITHVLVTLSGVGALLVLKQKYYSELRTKKLI